MSRPDESFPGHLSAERLAACDDAPSIEELAHLAGCLVCRQERMAYGRLVADAPSAFPVDPQAPRLVPWETIATGLSARGTARPPLPDPASDDRPVGWGRTVRRLVAAGLFMATGAGLERWSAPPLGEERPSSVTESVDGGAAMPFSTVDQASEALGRAYRDYERAALWLAAHDRTQQDPESVRARLAALDRMLAASRSGLQAAPQDPVLNHYQLSAWAVREATLQQLGGVLPVGESLARY